MKAAAPQAPGSANVTATTPAKGRAASAAPATVAGATAFAGVLAKTMASNGPPTTRVRTAIRPPAPAEPGRKADAARGRTSIRDAARTAGRRRDGETAAAERPAAEAAVGRALAAVLPSAAEARPTEAKAATAAGPARRADLRVMVTDLRKHPASGEPSAGRPASTSVPERIDGSVLSPKPFAEPLAAPSAEAKAALPARATPLERIREMTGSDLVRTVGLVVRDGGGEIRLTLKPESLGSVRIRLILEDGRVEGRIVVDTPEARQAFEAGIESLTRALQADGFQTGSLQVSVSGGGANDSRQAAGLLDDTIQGARARASDEALRAAVPPAGWTVGGDGLVNVFA